MDLGQLAAGKTLSSSAVFLLVTVLLLAASRRVSTSIILFGLQSAIITAQVMATAYTEKSAEAWVVAGLVFALKVVAIPAALLWLVKRLKSPRAIQPSISSAKAVFVAAFIIFLSYAVVQPYVRESSVPQDALAASVALILTGAFLMVSQRKALIEGNQRAQGCSGVESPRGELFYWVEASGGLITRCHIKSPSFQNWPALPFAVVGNVIADFPLINKSFNLSYSGCDR